MYRIGLPLWKLIAKLGVPLVYRVEIVHDVQAGVYVGTSPDIQGLIIEMPTLDTLMQEMRLYATDLVEAQLHSKPSTPLMNMWAGHVALA
jgi:hypothetical protein